MKVFISHSSYDSWIAQNIAAKLAAVQVNSLLDAKDLLTGDSINGMITTRLSDCDELLLVLSPTSLKSTWVFIEVGGALALGKRIATLLLHVGANEVPHPLNQHLCRDINDFDRYLAEVRMRASTVGGAPSSVSHSPPSISSKVYLPHQTGPKTGDRVRVRDSASLSDDSKRRPPVWKPDMDRFSGRICKVVRIDGKYLRLNDPELEHIWWLQDWIEPID